MQELELNIFQEVQELNIQEMKMQSGGVGWTISVLVPEYYLLQQN
jgi:hypothetical protein